MGRTVPTFRMVLESVIAEWNGFRRALRKDERAAFDQMMKRAREHAAAATFSARLNPTEAMFMAILLLAGTLSPRSTDQTSDEEEAIWSEQYDSEQIEDAQFVPIHQLGSADGSWWSGYPTQHPRTGDPVNHTDWILDALQDGPVLVLNTMKWCKACDRQKADLEVALAGQGPDFTYFELWADEEDDEERFDEVYDVYDPDRDPDKASEGDARERQVLDE